jgi:hypothetical protein
MQPLDSIIFTCGLCGKGHPALPAIVPDFPPEEVERLRAAWLAAEAKVAWSAKDTRVLDKAWMQYMATKSNGVPRLPDTITTIKKGGSYIFLCADHAAIG